MQFRETIDNSEINDLPLLQFDGKIHLIETKRDQYAAAEILREEEVLGFDTESRPAFRKGVSYPVSLLQLSTEDDAYLFRLNNSPLEIPLLKVLEDDDILKVGVAITDDISELRSHRDFDPGGFLALERFVKQAGIESNGLRKIAAITLNGRISKSAQVSNWEAKELNKKQLLYAATDAWVGLMIYKKLIANGYFDHS